MITRLLFNSTLVVSLLGSFAGIAHAESPTTKLVHQQILRFGVGARSSFCYAEGDQPVQGYQVDKMVQIASVMKVLTTFWAVEKLGVDFRFKTRIFIQPDTKEMHIQGQRDPFFDRQRLGIVLADLNRLGYKQMNRITADENFRIDYAALNVMLDYHYAHTFDHAGTSIAAQDVKNKIIEGFNTADWSDAKKTAYKRLVKQNSDLKLPDEVSFKVDAVDIVSGNPLAGKPGVIELEIKSAPLKTYLREMNILSVNSFADELFSTLGGIGGFRAFMQSKFGDKFDFSRVYTGSGLPTNDGHRDTETTCHAVVSVIQKLDQDLEAKGSDLNQVMMISGRDVQEGVTLKDMSQTLILKTGSVDGARNIAGSETTSKNEVYFGIFMQGAKMNKSHSVKALENFKIGMPGKRDQGSAFHFKPLDEQMHLVPSPVEVRRPL